MYKYLAISGGGVKGLSMLGSLRMLEGLGLLDEVEEYIGSSIGGVLVTMLSMGFTSKEMCEIAFALNPGNFVDLNIVEIFNNLGLDDGSRIVKLFRSMLKMKGGNGNGNGNGSGSGSGSGADITFLEHYEKTGKLVTLTGSCLNDKKLYYFNVRESPKMKIIDALRITLSFPIFFTPVVYNGKLFVDGAFLAPNPAIYYRDVLDEKDWNRLLVLFSNTEMPYVTTESMTSDPTQYLANILNSFKATYIGGHIEDFIEKERVIVFNNSNFAMNFNLNDKEKFRLYMKGCVLTWLYLVGAEWERIEKWKAFKKLKSCFC